MSGETNIWGIHAGKTGDADALFLKSNCVALGWTKIDDLGTLSPTREAFKTRVAEMYPDKPGAVPVNAGQLFRFVHEMKRGDFVAYPSKRDRHVHLGRVEGNSATIRRPSQGTLMFELSSGCATFRGQRLGMLHLRLLSDLEIVV
jgi:hypothetical protein